MLLAKGCAIDPVALETFIASTTLPVPPIIFRRLSLLLILLLESGRKPLPVLRAHSLLLWLLRLRVVRCRHQQISLRFALKRRHIKRLHVLLERSVVWLTRKAWCHYVVQGQVRGLLRELSRNVRRCLRQIIGAACYWRTSLAARPQARAKAALILEVRNCVLAVVHFVLCR